ncbi:MAG: hypothetical protein KDA27_03275 [Candidatus Eisenbacteria bacterium]|uniref:Uncharacterized protein n=1 Tax=Eiseniibacteriota bacterium TaxID=2212470 RepID=A0A956N9R0_UNCEI|nr:hypothetical protein [Candidatus Eisenbacteria bacterium]MCB9464699.1 hypothetical protein [Candidatus Eisenbacteria bacterium]
MSHSDRDLPSDLRERADRARAAGRWESPGEDAVRRLLSRDVDMAWADSGDAEEMTLDPADVRSPALSVEPRPELVSKVFSDGELAIQVRPAAEGVETEIRGRLWLRDGGGADLLLLQDDHVLASSRCESGKEFLFAELLLPGWELEVRRENGRVLRVRSS